MFISGQYTQGKILSTNKYRVKLSVFLNYSE